RMVVCWAQLLIIHGASAAASVPAIPGRERKGGLHGTAGRAAAVTTESEHAESSGAVQFNPGRDYLVDAEFDGAVFGLDGASVGFAPDFRELGADQEDHRRIVDPEDEEHQRPRGSISAGGAAAAEIRADQEFAEREEERSDGGSNPNVAPAD